MRDTFDVSKTAPKGRKTDPWEQLWVHRCEKQGSVINIQHINQNRIIFEPAINKRDITGVEYRILQNTRMEVGGLTIRNASTSEIQQTLLQMVIQNK
jgi:hypothetical protein